jgi:hypothetical protein
MRLLKVVRSENDSYRGFRLIERFGEDIPPYAILSHTWGGDDDEVTFKDILKGRGYYKSGYRKLRFCADHAFAEGLRYIWVDTCCIDKRSSAELSEAINSMYRWYQNCTKCYVYLDDITVPEKDIVFGEYSVFARLQRDRVCDWEWKRYLAGARWFTRGWTLQELLAPNKVVFFATQRTRSRTIAMHLSSIYLGDKEELAESLHEATGISVAALLHQKPLSDFSVEERLSWAAGRKTKREEDMAYSLLGLFDIHMPLLYGEGYEKAFYRLKKEIDESLTRKKPPTHPLQREDPPHPLPPLYERAPRSPFSVEEGDR